MTGLNSLPFTKMHGLGNDFILLNGFTEPLTLSTELIRKLAHRRLGIGCDQLIVVEKPTNRNADFFYRIYNNDGSEAGQCGNGARCFAIYVSTHGLTPKKKLRLQTLTSVIETKIEDNGDVSVDMGAPIFDPKKVPFTGGAGAIVESIDLLGESVPISVLSMGNPHAVQVVPNILEAPVSTQGSFLETHVRFPKGVNAGYMQVVSKDHIRLRVWERGVDEETMACGTGACAAVVAGIRRGLLNDLVTVETKGGFLSVYWDSSKPDSSVILRGPTVTSFEGVWTQPT
ncbi:MAG: diaminopimelate epimerase [Burkholderiales bacterium]|jgi:diaminopimelate epimerase|nr:diaminopimelate epimerase [Burkholderiales bacterium]